MVSGTKTNPNAVFGVGVGLYPIFVRAAAG